MEPDRNTLSEGKLLAPMAYLAMTNINPTVWSAPIDEKRRIIGRGKNAEIRVSAEFPCVSRLHAAIWVEGEAMRLEDLGSACGTRVNGVWLTQGRKVRIAVGDRIWMGEMELYVAEHLPVLACVLAERGLEMDEAVSERTHANGETSPESVLLSTLTPTELEVVLWMGRGYIDDEELGQALHRSPHTIRTHMKNIFQKLDIHSRAEIVAWLRRSQ